ncbi:MAG: SDR family NAD(P)-dependent oxidoreductase [Bacteroidales bacterium]|nr:SDR family NAD(P)-dependent oxidoreductase [Bacteroidales bacterium]
MSNNNKNKIAIVTGADGGMGQEIVLEVAKQGYYVVMACVNPSKSQDLCQKLREESGNKNIYVHELDLTNFSVIDKFVSEIKQIGMPIALLANNAGVLCWNRENTIHGIEKTMAVNYVGPYRLTNLLLSLMGEGSRIVNTVSCTYLIGRVAEEPFYRTQSCFNRFIFYSDSKLALTLFTLKLSEEVKDRGINVNASDPGIVSTNIIRMGNIVVDKLCDWFFRPFIYQPKRGASTAVKLLLDPELKGVTGTVYANKKRTNIPKRVLNHPKMEWLWKATQLLIAEIEHNQH